jgi:hypothetical protein
MEITTWGGDGACLWGEGGVELGEESHGGRGGGQYNPPGQILHHTRKGSNLDENDTIKCVQL